MGRTTNEELIATAKKFTNHKDFKAKHPAKRVSIYRRNIADIAFSDYVLFREPRNRWSEEKTKEECLKYKTRAALKRSNPKLYNRIIKNRFWHLAPHLPPGNLGFNPSRFRVIIYQASSSFNKLEFKELWPDSYKHVEEIKAFDKLDNLYGTYYKD